VEFARPDLQPRRPLPSWRVCPRHVAFGRGPGHSLFYPRRAFEAFFRRPVSRPVREQLESFLAREREDPLPHWDGREDVADEVVGAVLHAAGGARGADRGLAGEGDELLEAAVRASDPCKTAGQYPTASVSSQLEGGQGAAVAAPLAGLRQEGLKVFPEDGVEECLLRLPPTVAQRSAGGVAMALPGRGRRTAAQASDRVARRSQAPDTATQAPRLTVMVTMGAPDRSQDGPTDRATDVGGLVGLSRQAVVADEHVVGDDLRGEVLGEEHVARVSSSKRSGSTDPWVVPPAVPRAGDEAENEGVMAPFGVDTLL